MNEAIYAMWLSSIQGMTPQKCCTLFHFYGSFEKLFYQLPIDLEMNVLKLENKGKNITSKEISDYQKKIMDFKDYYQKLQDKKVHVITPLDMEYPNKLKELPDGPIVLYLRGNKALPEFGIAIVGARRCSPYGKKVAHHMSCELAKAGVNIISGLAYGVDVAAHEGALMAGGFTTAVLGGGLHKCYPEKHLDIFKKIMETGSLISEEPYGVNTLPYMFPKRNRIISGLSYGVLVVEAAKKSGSLITVDFALEQGREVFTVPGRLFDPFAEGTNNLMKQGAKTVFHYDDILSEFEHIFQNKGEKKTIFEKKLEEKEKIVYSCISYDPIHEEVLIQSVFEAISICVGTQLEDTTYNQDEMKSLVAMDDSDIHLALLTLELYGLIVKKSGCYYARSEV